MIKNFIANKEDINVEASAAKRGKRSDKEILSREKINSANAASKIAGIPRRKEYLAASFLSQPVRRAVEIVMPDLDTPGIIANA